MSAEERKAAREARRNARKVEIDRLKKVVDGESSGSDIKEENNNLNNLKEKADKEREEKERLEKLEKEKAEREKADKEREREEKEKKEKLEKERQEKEKEKEKEKREEEAKKGAKNSQNEAQNAPLSSPKTTNNNNNEKKEKDEAEELARREAAEKKKENLRNELAALAKQLESYKVAMYEEEVAKQQELAAKILAKTTKVGESSKSDDKSTTSGDSRSNSNSNSNSKDNTRRSELFGAARRRSLEEKELANSTAEPKKEEKPTSPEGSGSGRRGLMMGSARRTDVGGSSPGGGGSIIRGLITLRGSKNTKKDKKAAPIEKDEPDSPKSPKSPKRLTLSLSRSEGRRLTRGLADLSDSENDSSSPRNDDKDKDKGVVVMSPESQRRMTRGGSLRLKNAVIEEQKDERFGKKGGVSGSVIVTPRASGTTPRGMGHRASITSMFDSPRSGPTDNSTSPRTSPLAETHKPGKKSSKRTSGEIKADNRKHKRKSGERSASIAGIEGASDPGVPTRSLAKSSPNVNDNRRSSSPNVDLRLSKDKIKSAQVAAQPKQAEPPRRSLLSRTLSMNFSNQNPTKITRGKKDDEPVEDPTTKSVFGCTIEQIMKAQGEGDIPKILASLAEAVIAFGGNQVEGIFRLSADGSCLSELRNFFDTTKDYSLSGISSVTSDPHVAAATLKAWLRQLAEPLVPPPLYDSCIAGARNPIIAYALLQDARFPEQNRKVLVYIIEFLMDLDRYSSVTRMDLSNLCLVFAPGILRYNGVLDPATLLSNAALEALFVQSLIEGHQQTVQRNKEEAASANTETKKEKKPKRKEKTAAGATPGEEKKEKKEKRDKASAAGGEEDKPVKKHKREKSQKQDTESAPNAEKSSEKKEKSKRGEGEGKGEKREKKKKESDASDTEGGDVSSKSVKKKKKKSQRSADQAHASIPEEPESRF